MTITMHSDFDAVTMLQNGSRNRSSRNGTHLRQQKHHSQESSRRCVRSSQNVQKRHDRSSPRYASPIQMHSDCPSPTYAGAKFSEPPAPTFLPKPPVSWTKSERPRFAFTAMASGAPHDMSGQLKAILRVM